MEIKKKIHEYKAQNPGEKKISSELMSEAFRWRLEQNDCQNRGYVLDGYPMCYKTCKEVFFITPPPIEKKPLEKDDEGNDIPNEEEEMDPEELKKLMAPKFQEKIYPDSVIMLRGDDDYIRDRARDLGEKNEKWDPENLERRLETYRENNDIDLFSSAKQRTDLGHPKTVQPKFPLIRFFQENKTEIFEIDCDGKQFEMFESMRIYIERNGRSYNYLHSVKVLNVRREQALMKEEQDTKTQEAQKQK